MSYEEKPSMRQHYQVTTKFNYKNGTTGGVLRREVNSKKAVAIQVAANREWLAIKGHTEIDTSVEPCDILAMFDDVALDAADAWLDAPGTLTRSAHSRCCT